MSPDVLDALRYRAVGPVELYLGDARQALAAMPADSIDCVATSPPFWALRDYGTGAWTGGDPECTHHHGRGQRSPGVVCRRCPAVWVDPQYGPENTVEKYVTRLVTVFDEVRRVLKPSGTVWLNLGDRYTSGPPHAHPLGAAHGDAIGVDISADFHDEALTRLGSHLLAAASGGPAS